MSKSLPEQVRAAIEAGGGPAAVARAIQSAGGKTTSQLLSTICGGRTPSAATLVEISKAVGGWPFTIDKDTDIGTSRVPNPSEKK